MIEEVSSFKLAEEDDDIPDEEDETVIVQEIANNRLLKTNDQLKDASEK